jgi:hypothetical protein
MRAEKAEAEVERLQATLATHQDFIRRHFLAGVFSAEAEALLGEVKSD